jgi:hypothetical protein
MPPRDFFELEEAEAEAYLDAYRAVARERLAWLERVVAARGGEPVALDGTPESLVPLWRWFVAWHDAGHVNGQTPPGTPMWYEPDEPGAEALDPPTLWIVDGIGYYLAEVVTMNVPGVDWAVSTSPKRLRYEDRNKPVLIGPSGARLSPVDLAYGGAVLLIMMGGARGSREDDDLLRLFQRWESVLRGRGT